MPAKRAYHHGNLRAALVAAALKELAATGLEKFSLRNVARRAKVSAPAVYRHFADKDDLVVAVALECAERMNAAMAAAISRAPADPLEGFREVGIAIVTFAVAHPEHYRVISLPDLAAKTPPALREQERTWYEAQKRSLAEAQRRGLISDVPLDDLMLTADSAINGLAHTIIEGKLGPVDAARAKELAVRVTHVLGCGFMPRDTPPFDPRA
jgi:AcrR family transcriptional regulator